ncbi:MAG: sigma-70 family RNA polymerase sigma factor [Phormidesmis sp.]
MVAARLESRRLSADGQALERSWSQRRSKNQQFEQPLALWQQWQETRDPRIKAKLAQHNSRLASQVAHRWAELCEIEFEDLEQLATIGLLKAIDGFDISKGNRFSSYAMPWVKGEILHFLRDKGRLYSVPRKAREIKARVGKIHRMLLKGGGQASLADVALAEGISAEGWAWILEATEKRPMAQLNEAVHVAASQPDWEREHLYESLRLEVAKLPNPGRTFLHENVWCGLAVEAIAQRAGQTTAFVQQQIEASLAKLQTCQPLSDLQA